MKKITVTATVRITLHANENVDLEKVCQELDYDFKDTTGEADVVGTEITEFGIEDCR